MYTNGHICAIILKYEHFTLWNELNLNSEAYGWYCNVTNGCQWSTQYSFHELMSRAKVFAILFLLRAERSSTFQTNSPISTFTLFSFHLQLNAGFKFPIHFAAAIIDREKRMRGFEIKTPKKETSCVSRISPLYLSHSMLLTYKSMF